MIPRYDHFLVGLGVALAVAFVSYALLLSAVDFANASFGFTMQFRPRSLALIALCINVVPMNWFKKRYYNKSMRGVVVSTFLLAVAWFVYFGNDLLNGTP